jgi:PKD repeat protein
LYSHGNSLRKILEAFFICFVLIGITIAANTATPQINDLNPIALPAITSSGPSYSGHIVFIILENHPLSSVTCSGCASYMTSLGNSYASSTNYVGPLDSSWKPSLPNYLGLFSGQTWGCTSDVLPNYGCATGAWTCSSPCNIVDRFSTTGISWKGYMEGMPGSNICNSNGGSDGGTHYVAHHNPFVYFGNIVNNSTRCSSVVPSGSSGGATTCGTSVTTSVISNLVNDLNRTAPGFSWVTPNTFDDSHDCNVQQASNWLSVVVPAIVTTKTFESDVSATIVITFDEPTTGTYGTTPVYIVVAGPGAKPHYSSSTRFTHLNWLATIESNWSLGCLVSRNDCGASVMSEFFANQYEFLARFTYSPSDPGPNQMIIFTASVSGGAQPYLYNWNFGDGNGGTGQPVSHTYAKAGSFTTSLTVTDAASHVVTTSQVLTVGANGFCLQCLVSSLSSSPQLPIGLAIGLTLTALAAVWAKRRGRSAILEDPRGSMSP